ncbi:hypothetical protein [Xanthomonas theicola]|uniref:hypothetical protein n=1 Tax=Xanthomonas theicola TaxID=56464 RepID=UPI000FF889AC|nr:hypothetical protein [Xanthomonas theicola]QNH24914.1 hypothetical protein G4Q83_09370 [Xanthomonas theicola]
MTLRKALLFTALMLSAGTSQAWTMVYATDANGNVSEGSLQSLRVAVNNGASVKVLVTGANIHVWGVPCTYTSVKLDASQAVVCVSNQGLGMEIAMGSNFGAVSNLAQSVHYVINTSGQYAQANLNIGTGQLVSRSVLIHAMQWYVE